VKKVGMNEEEKNMHGSKWEKTLNGVFFDSNISSPFINFIINAIDKNIPDVIADIGGGTGFLLDQLIKNGIDNIKKDIKLINIDVSKAQVADIINKRIIGYQASATNFTRSFFDKSDDQKITLIMRYVLHYFGSKKIKNALTNIRSQMKEGELLIHHTLCTDTEEDGVVINYFFQNFAGIYNESHKRIPSFKQIVELLNSSGFITTDIKIAEIELYTQNLLVSRYKITEEDIGKIKEFAKNHSCRLYRENEKGINLDLPSRFFCCKAI